MKLHKGNLIALISVGSNYAEVMGRRDPVDPSYIIHKWNNSTGSGRSKIISCKPCGLTPAMVLDMVRSDENLAATVRGCVAKCSTAGNVCGDCRVNRPHYHFYFAESDTPRGFDVVSYPCLNIMCWKEYLEGENSFIVG